MQQMQVILNLSCRRHRIKYAATRYTSQQKNCQVQSPFQSNLHDTRDTTTERVTTGGAHSSLNAREKRCSSGEPLATLCLSYPARELNSEPPRG